MGKIVTIYLSDEEARELRDFCDENQCTQYSALKTAVKQILCAPMQREEEDVPEDIIDEPQEETVISDEVVEESIEEPDVDEGIVENSVESFLERLLRIRKLRAESGINTGTRT